MSLCQLSIIPKDAAQRICDLTAALAAGNPANDAHPS